MEHKSWSFDKQSINKNVFHKNKKLIGIDKVDIRKIVLPKKIYIVKMVHLNILLDLYMKVTLFVYHYAYIKLLQLNGYVKYFDKNNKCINLLVRGKELLKIQYNMAYDNKS